MHCNICACRELSCLLLLPYRELTSPYVSLQDLTLFFSDPVFLSLTKAYRKAYRVATQRLVGYAKNANPPYSWAVEPSVLMTMNSHLPAAQVDGGEGGRSRLLPPATLVHPVRQDLLGPSMRLALRAAASRRSGSLPAILVEPSARVRVHHSQSSIKGTYKTGPFDRRWRRGRDSNPRYAFDVHTLSRRAP